MSASSESMSTAQVTLTADLHARPAAQVVRIVAAHEAGVWLRVGDRDADGRSVLALMGLGAVAGQDVTVRADGPQAAEALAAVTALLTAPAVESTH
jgi:phosphotransferase system HPr (HPr) family protein